MDSSHSVRWGNTGRTASLAVATSEETPTHLTAARASVASVAKTSAHRPDPPSPLRVAIIDGDSGFIAVLSNRLLRLEWKPQMLSFNVKPANVARRELDVLIVDLVGLGERRWEW